MFGIVLTLLLICLTNLSMVALAVNAPSTSPTVSTRRPTIAPFNYPTFHAPTDQTVEPTVEPTSAPFSGPNVQGGTVSGAVFAAFFFLIVIICVVSCVRSATKAGARMRLRALAKREMKLNAKMRRLEEQINSGRISFFSSAQAQQLKYDGYVTKQKSIQEDMREINRKFFPEDTRAAAMPDARPSPSFAGTPDTRMPPGFALTSSARIRDSVPYADVVTTGDLDTPTATVAYPRI